MTKRDQKQITKYQRERFEPDNDGHGRVSSWAEEKIMKRLNAKRGNNAMKEAFALAKTKL